MKIPLLSSLRSRLITASIVLQAMVLVALLFTSLRTWNETLARSTDARVTELSQLFNLALGPSLASGNPAQAAQWLDRLRVPEGVHYLVLLDPRGRIVAARGWDVSRPLPDVTRISPSFLPEKVNAATPIGVGEEKLGELRFGLSTEILREGARNVVSQGIWIVLTGLVFSSLFMLLVSRRLVGYLNRLIDTTEKAAHGTHEDVPALVGQDEISRLARRFHEMTRNIREQIRVAAENEAHYRRIADFTHAAEFLLDPAGRLAWVNSSVMRLTGYSVGECGILPDFPLVLATPDERDRVAETLDQALQNRSTQQDFEFRGQRRDGKLFWASLAWQPLFDEAGDYLGLRISLRDNTSLKEDRLALRKAVAELRQSHSLGQSYLARAETERARLMALLSAMRFGVLFIDNNHRVVFHNPAFCDLWGVARSLELAGRPLGLILQQAENRPVLSDLVSTYLGDMARVETRIDQGELTLNDGRIITQQCYRVLDPQGSSSGWMWLFEDVTQERQLADHMTNLAERDVLTGLYNRHRFQQELERMVSETDRRQGSMALLFFDLDEFKHVNDTLGHGVGDQLLQLIAKEVGQQVRRHEVLARLGGDEFAVLVPDCNEFEVSRLAERIVMTLSQISFTVDGHTLRPSTSVGVAMFPQHAATSGELVAHADSAMYQAKSAGKSTWRMYRREADPSRNVIVRLSWKDRIQEALKNDGFELHFQGIYHCEDRSLAHLEALVRMRDGQSPGSLVMPGQFIQHAETTGKIVEIDRWVLHQVVELLSLRPDIPSIAINISGRSFDEPGFPEYISQLLVSRRVEPRRLLVELTETAAVSDMHDAQRFIDALRATGCTVCLDDFGSGFASFAYLKQLKADVLKIDGLFIRDLPTDRDSEIFVRGMVAMARDMGKITIAEFVENEEIFNMLREIGIDQVQGYYLDRPSPNHPSLASPAGMAVQIKSE